MVRMNSSSAESYVGKNIRSNLRYLRESNGISQRKMAEILGLSFTTYADYENGKSVPKIAVLKYISEFYNISLDELVTNDLVLLNIRKSSMSDSDTEFENHAYKKYEKGCFCLYHYRTHHKYKDTVSQGYLYIKKDTERKMYKVETVFENKGDSTLEYCYDGALVICGRYAYIYLKGKHFDRALIILPDPMSYKKYIGGIGIVLSTSEGYENSIPCSQYILLSNVDIPENKYDEIKKFLRLPEMKKESFFSLDKEKDKKVYEFLKKMQEYPKCLQQ